MNHQRTVLKNGIRIISSNMPQMRSVATTVYIKAGSRYESKKINGISHFLEHMLFKGTKKYPQQADIARSIEGIGGQLNAWTDQDHTAYWNLLPAKFGKVGLEVLSEMLFNSILDESAIDRERGVILEEINRQFDDPSTHVFELLINLMWPDQPLGWPVIGNKDNIKNIKRKDFVDYMDLLYQGKTIVVSVAGNIEHNEVVSVVEKLFLPKTSGELIVPIGVKNEQKLPRVNIYYKKTDQAHLAIGVHGLANSDPDKYAWSLMNVILGQGMSSRLFLNIREEKGLAYHISSGIDTYEDTGMLYVHAGLNLQKLNDAIEAICGEFQVMRDKPVDEGELRRAKDYTIGSINLSMDDTDSVSSWFGRQELLMKQVLTSEQVIEKIEKVTIADIQNIAKHVFCDKNINLSVIAPVKNSGQFESLLKVD